MKEKYLGNAQNTGIRLYVYTRTCLCACAIRALHVVCVRCAIQCRKLSTYYSKISLKFAEVWIIDTWYITELVGEEGDYWTRAMFAKRDTQPSETNARVINAVFANEFSLVFFCIDYDVTIREKYYFPRYIDKIMTIFPCLKLKGEVLLPAYEFRKKVFSTLNSMTFAVFLDWLS